MSRGSHAASPGRSDGSARLVLLRYLVQGAGLNFVGLVIFSTLYSLFEATSPVAIAVATTFLLFPLSFAVNRVWVFRSTAPLGPQVRRFLLVYVTAGASNVILFWVLYSSWTVSPVIIQAVVIALVVTAGFLANYLWTFARGHNESAVGGE
jgi:putative flippase GtrA